MKTAKKSKSNAALFLLSLVSILAIAGCSAKSPITKTYTEYIPPVTEDGSNCIQAISEKLRACEGRVRLETKLCQEESRKQAQHQFARAQADYQNRMSDLQEQQSRMEAERQTQLAAQKNAYIDCDNRRKTQQANYEAALKKWTRMKSGPRPVLQPWEVINCVPPSATAAPRTVPGDFGFMAPQPPSLEEFIKDAHCFSNTECADNYDANYERCAGRVVKTTRCFANCGQ